MADNNPVEQIKSLLDDHNKVINEDIGTIKDRLKTVEAKAGSLENVASKDEVTQLTNKLIDELKVVNTAIDALEKRTSAATMQIDQPGGVYKSFGHQLQDVIAAAKPGTARYSDAMDRLEKVVKNAASGMSEGIPSDGGFLIDPQYSNELFKIAHDQSVLAGRCREIQLSNSNTLNMKVIDETSRANGSRWGGVQSYWEGEAGSPTASKPKLGEMTWKLKKLTALCYATEELLEDAAALQSLITPAFAEEFGFRIDDAIIRGTGAGEPLGYMSAPCLVTVSKETGQAADTLDFENIRKMWARMWARSRMNSVWLVNQESESALQTLNIPVGTGGIPVYLPPGGLSSAPYGALYGRPVIAIEQAAALGDLGDIMLVDMSQYMLAGRGGMKSASSIHVKFVEGETAFRFVMRLDGQPLWKSALTPYKAASGATLSPFVTLQAR